MAVSPTEATEAEAYELPDLAEGTSSPKLYEDDEDVGAESAQLLRSKVPDGLNGDESEESILLRRPGAVDEDIGGKGTNVEALIARVCMHVSKLDLFIDKPSDRSKYR